MEEDAEELRQQLQHRDRHIDQLIAYLQRVKANKHIMPFAHPKDIWETIGSTITDGTVGHGVHCMGKSATFNTLTTTMWVRLQVGLRYCMSAIVLEMSELLNLHELYSKVPREIAIVAEYSRVW